MPASTIFPRSSRSFRASTSMSASIFESALSCAAHDVKPGSRSQQRSGRAEEAQRREERRKKRLAPSPSSSSRPWPRGRTPPSSSPRSPLSTPSRPLAGGAAAPAASGVQSRKRLACDDYAENRYTVRVGRGDQRYCSTPTLSLRPCLRRFCRHKPNWTLEGRRKHQQTRPALRVRFRVCSDLQL